MNETEGIDIQKFVNDLANLNNARRILSALKIQDDEYVVFKQKKTSNFLLLLFQLNKKELYVINIKLPRVIS